MQLKHLRTSDYFDLYTFYLYIHLHKRKKLLQKKLFKVAKYKILVMNLNLKSVC